MIRKKKKETVLLTVKQCVHYNHRLLLRDTHINKTFTCQHTCLCDLVELRNSALGDDIFDSTTGPGRSSFVARSVFETHMPCLTMATSPRSGAKERPMRVRCSYLYAAHCDLSQSLGKRKNALFTSSRPRIYPPGTEPIVVIKGGGSVLVSANQTFNLSCEVRRTITNQ